MDKFYFKRFRTSANSLKVYDTLWVCIRFVFLDMIKCLGNAFLVAWLIAVNMEVNESE